MFILMAVFLAVAPHDKIALVIGNLNYKKKQFDKLAYTMNDAYDIAAALVELQFKVHFQNHILRFLTVASFMYYRWP